MFLVILFKLPIVFLYQCESIFNIADEGTVQLYCHRVETRGELCLYEYNILLSNFKIYDECCQLTITNCANDGYFKNKSCLMH